MSSQDHTYLCKALFACLNQAVAQIQSAENSAVRLLAKHNIKSFYQCFIPADRRLDITMMLWYAEYFTMDSSALLKLLGLGGKKCSSTVFLVHYD